MRRVIAFMMTVLMVAALAGCTEKVDLSEVKLEDIEKANKGSRLLEDHSSVSYKMEFRGEEGKVTEEAILSKKDDGHDYYVKMQSSGDFREEVYKDNFLYAEYGGNDDGVNYEVNWFMDGLFDEFMEESIAGFLVNGTDGLEITKREEKENFMSVTAQVDEGDNVSEEYDFFYEYVMDKDNLEITQFVGYSLDQEKEQSIQSFAEVSYDESYEEPAFLAKLEKPSKKRTVTIVMNPGKSNEKTTKLEISAQAVFDVALKDGYGVYTDKEGTKEYTKQSDRLLESGMYDDLKLYLVKE